jgi:Uma2 family endonuclease
MTRTTHPLAMLCHAELPPVAEDLQIMGMPAVSPEITTIDALLALPDDGMRHELLDGVHAVTPSPVLLHQVMLREIEHRIAAALARQDRFQVLWSPADIVLGPRILVQPDLFVIDVPSGKHLRSWADVGVPVLAVEILSPGTAVRDRGAKRRIYQRAGVAEYWIVDLDARLIERWRPGDERPEILDDRLVWQVGELPGATFELRALFAGVLEPGGSSQAGTTP